MWQLTQHTLRKGRNEHAAYKHKETSKIIEWALDTFHATANELHVFSLIEINNEKYKNKAPESVQSSTQLFQLNVKILFCHKNNDHRTSKPSLTSGHRLECFQESGY
jgi:hypothetical protein